MIFACMRQPSQPLPGLVQIPEPSAPWQSLIQTHRRQHAVDMYRVAREG